MYTMLFLGIIGAGGRFTGSNPAYTSAELSHHMRTTGSRFLISEPELLPRVAPAIKECSLPVSNVFIFDPTGRDFPLYYCSWKDLLDHGESDWVRFKRDDESKTTTAALLSTSGTTGLPKAAMISHYNCIVQNIMLNDSRSKTYEVGLIDPQICENVH
jgi:acyl-CoA synthetase (AMP-forming)/AMP-acid ligase II